jgi:hypothetical protein
MSTTSTTVSTTSICKTCKHWQDATDCHGDPKEDNIITPIDPDLWVPMQMPFEVKLCKSPKLMMFERPIEADMASCCDGSDYRAVLYTGENYGCIHYEEQ